MLTYYGITNTFDHGESYISSVTDFDVKQIAAQTNGYVVLKFTTSEGLTVEEKLALPVQFAQIIMQSELIPIRYLESSFNPIVIMPVYELQQSVIKVNISVTSIGLIATFLVSFFASKFAIRRIREGEENLEIERVD